MGEISAAGDLVTGALIGRAMEPHAGEGGGHGDLCLNCGTALIGPHCHRCGQSAHVHRSLSGIGHDLLHGVFHFEGKLWHTLPMLAWRPGELTRRYIDGERARFVSPIAIFLFSIFALYAVFSFLNASPIGNITTTPNTPAQVIEIKKRLGEARDELAAERAKLAPGDSREHSLDRRIADTDRTIASVAVGKPVGGLVQTDLKINTGWHALDEGIEHAMKEPALTIYMFKSNSYKFSWLLIVLSVPFVWLLFAWRREFRLYDHAVFVTYSIAFMSLLFVVLNLAAAAGAPDEVLQPLTAVIVPVHLYRDVRGTYRLSRIGSALRTIALLLISFFVVLMFFAIMLLMGFLE